MLYLELPTEEADDPMFLSLSYPSTKAKSMVEVG